MPKKTFLKLSAEKQQRILNAATDEFIQYKDHYEKSSVNRIAEKAGISVGSIYKYFNDKDDLFLCVFSNNKKDPVNLTESDTLYDYSQKEIAFDPSKTEIGDKLLDIIRSNVNLFQKLVFNDSMDPDYAKKIKDFIAKDKDRGFLRKDTDLEAAAYLYSTLEFNAYQYCVAHNIDFSYEIEIFRKMADMFFFGIYRDSLEDEIKT